MRTNPRTPRRQDGRQRGFTLPEILIALSIISLITVVTLGAIGPWLDFRQKLETERKLNEVKEGLTTYYRNNAFALETVTTDTFGPFVEATVSGAGVCNSQGAAFSVLGFSLSDSGDKAALDGYGNAFCVFISPQRTRAIDGTSLYYRTVAVVSTGSNGSLDPGTRINPTTDALELAGDDQGITISGLGIQQEKYYATIRRLERVAEMYETYFTTRFLQAADRDISRYYFSTTYDASGAVASTNNVYSAVFPAMQNIGVSPDLGKTAWEINNDIVFNNHNGAALGAGLPAPRTPATTGITALPYTAVIAARVPAPGAARYIVRVAVGNY
jgi:prepilin-type N-terminal cleavage/methylation domain-containing protein